MRAVVIACLLISASAAALAHEGHSHATGVVKERMELMTTLGERMKAIAQRLRSRNDVAAIVADAHVIHRLAMKIPTQFPVGSIQHPTAAKPAIWQSWPDFESKAKSLEQEAEKLMNSDPRDAKALTAQVRTISQICSDCHETYRTTK